jgi:hypothetical protein
MNSSILTVSVDTRKIENMLNGYERNLPAAMDKMSKKIASMYAACYLMQFPQSRISPFTGHTYTLVESQIYNPTKLGRYHYGVKVPLYMVMLDSMRSHYVSLRRGRNITQWAKLKLGYTPRKLIVHKHPWIRSAHIKAGKNVRNIAEFEINKFLKVTA